MKFLLVLNQTFPSFLAVFFSNLTIDLKLCCSCYQEDTVVKQHFREVTGRPSTPPLGGQSMCPYWALGQELAWHVLCC